jgi:hypothetical protein
MFALSRAAWGFIDEFSGLANDIGKVAGLGNGAKQVDLGNGGVGGNDLTNGGDRLLAGLQTQGFTGCVLYCSALAEVISTVLEIKRHVLEDTDGVLGDGDTEMGFEGDGDTEMGFEGGAGA